MLQYGELELVFEAYGLDKKKYIGFRQIKTGHINNTFVIYMDKGNYVKRYLLQQININVFKKPEELMENIELVTTFCSEKLKKLGVDNYQNKFVRLKFTTDGKSYLRTINNSYYRIYHFVENSINFQVAHDEKMFENAGFTIGSFLNLLADFPAEKLHETIPDFHNTSVRYQTFLDVLNKDVKQRALTCSEEIEFVKQHKYLTHIITDLIDAKQMPIKVTHNDTKVNNIMFDYFEHTGLCMIDLDTTMPGSIVYDFGDAIRSGCTSAKEDEKDLSKVIFDINLFAAFAKGFISAVKETITQCELDNLVNGSIIMTFECGMRFLTDYLDGDNYFKTAYSDHNLVRCRSQFALVKQMLQQKEQMEQIIKNCI